MLLRLSLFLVVLAPVTCATFAQSSKPRDGENTFRGAVLTFVSQRCIPSKKVRYVGDDFDFSDLITRFRLENHGANEIYYLADNLLNGIEPVGFQLYRSNQTSDWEATHSPARGRDGIFTADVDKWFFLRPGFAIEFERTDVTNKGLQHATSVFLNSKPVHKNRVEIVSNAFAPINCPKRGK
jgi:hypothetical protein